MHYLHKECRVHDYHLNSKGLMKANQNIKGIPCARDGFTVPVDEFTDLMMNASALLSDAISRTDDGSKRFRISSFDEDEIFLLTGVRRDQFNITVEAVRSKLRNSHNRSIEEMVFMWYMKLRTDWSFRMLSLHLSSQCYKMGKGACRGAFNAVTSALQNSTLVRENIGTARLTYEEAYAENTPYSLVLASALGMKHKKTIAVVWDGTYLFKVKSRSDHWLQRLSYTSQKKSCLTKHMTIVFPSGLGLATFGPFMAHCNDAMASKLISRFQDIENRIKANVSVAGKDDDNDSEDGDDASWVFETRVHHNGSYSLNCLYMLYN